jgi:DNA polymerase-3 subunit epsilon
MSGWNWLTRPWRRPALTARQRQALAEYRALPRVPGTAPLALLRIVVVDVETTGLDPYNDRLLSIGAIDLRAGRLVPASAFSVVLRQPSVSDTGNILIHGIDGSTQLAGSEPAQALLDFLTHAGNAPLAGFNADFDRLMIGRAVERQLAVELHNPWLDLAWLAPALLPSPGKDVTLDGWTARYGIVNESRHHAVADAAATAQLFQVALAAAAAKGLHSVDDWQRLERDRRWLGRQ